jgi:hypothetical protein
MQESNTTPEIRLLIARALIRNHVLLKVMAMFLDVLSRQAFYLPWRTSRSQTIYTCIQA